MLATVTQYGEHTALILEQQILTRLHIDVNTLFDVEIEGQTLIMTPVQDEQRRQQRAASDTSGKSRRYCQRRQRGSDRPSW